MKIARSIVVPAPARKRAYLEITWTEKPPPRRRARRVIAALLVRIAARLAGLRVRVVSPD